MSDTSHVESEISLSSTGVVRTYFDTKKTKLGEEYFQLNGKKNGIYKSYYDNGILGSEVNYIDDKKNGIYKSYYYDGQLFY